MDAVLSIAVVHHFSNQTMRIHAINEMVINLKDLKDFWHFGFFWVFGINFALLRFLVESVETWRSNFNLRLGLRTRIT